MAMLAAGMSVPDAAATQGFLLQIRPRTGDTLSVRLNQKVEMTGTPAGCVTADAAPGRNTAPSVRPQPCAAGTRHMTTRTEVFSRAIIGRATPEGTMVLAVTDSVRTSATSSQNRDVEPTRRSVPQSSVELRVSTDGGAEVVDEAASDELRTIFGQMPAMLSRKAVAVGEKWVRQMRIPLPGESGKSGLVRATFQLDSLGSGGDVAFISMRGTMSHDHVDGRDSEPSGQLAGTIQLDRRLAWITETRAAITTQSTVTPASSGQPMLVRTRVTQLLRATR